MPATAQAARVTDAYRARLIRLRDRNADAAVATLRRIDLDVPPAALERQFTVWRQRAARTSSAAADQASTLTAAYLSAYLVASGAQPATVELVPQPPDTGWLDAARTALLWRLGQGAGRSVATRTAEAVAARAARELVTVPALRLLVDGIRREPQITGWQRVTSGSCCARCAVQAGKLFRDNDGFQRHPACRCTHEPVVLGRPERFTRRPPAVAAA